MQPESWKYDDSTLESVHSAHVELVTIVLSKEASDRARYEIVELLLVKDPVENVIQQLCGTLF